MNKKQLFSFLLLFIGMTPLLGMEITTHYYDNNDNLPGRMQSLLNDPLFDEFGVNLYVASHKNIINTMKELPKRGATITGTFGKHYKNDDISHIHGLSFEEDEHGKYWRAKGTDSEGKEHTKCLITKAHPTYNAYRNHDSMIEVENDPDFFDQIEYTMNSYSPVKKKQKIDNTPIKNSAYSSLKYNINKSLAKRIDNIANNKDDDRKLEMATMNLTDKITANSLTNAAKKGVNVALLVNKSALTKKSIPLFKKIEKAGGHVSVFDPEDKQHRILHLGTTRIATAKKCLVIHSTGNLTEEGNEQHNILSMFPNNLPLNTASAQHFEKVKKECTPLEEAIPLFEANKENKIQKRKANP